MGIQNSPMLEVAIGLVLLYLLLGLLCTAVNELVAQAFNLRAETLWATVRGLMNDPGGNGAAKDLYNHPLIRSLSVRNGDKQDRGGDDPAKRAKPSYIPASIFSLAILDMIANPAGQQGAPLHVTTADLLADLPKSTLPPEVQQALVPLIHAAHGNIDQARKNIEVWYDSTMERASGWYKQRVQKITLFVGFLTVFYANADTIMFVDALWANPLQRAQLVEVARNWRPPVGTHLDAATKTTPDAIASSDTATGVDSFPSNNTPGTGTAGAIAQPGLPPIPPALQSLLGWSGPIDPHARNYVRTDPRRFPGNDWEWLYKLLGLLLSTFAASLGAPFWFDILNKIVNIRSSGTSPNEEPRRPSKKPDPDARVSNPPADGEAPQSTQDTGANP
jgi:hypothetical protein